MPRLTEDECKAMEWLKDAAEDVDARGQIMRDCPKDGKLRTLLAMLAQPRMPEEPTDAAVQAIYKLVSSYHKGPLFSAAIYTALRAELSKPPEPETKEVEVWHVEWSDGSIPHIDDPYLSREDAEKGANRRRMESRGQCITVTGPHKQRVPA